MQINQRAGNKKKKSDAKSESYRDWAIITIYNHSILVIIAISRLPFFVLIPFGLLLGLGFAMAAVTVLHDGGHHRFSRSYLPNMLAVQIAAPIGLWLMHFTLKHRVHHRLTAVYPVDEFTKVNWLVRFHPRAPLRPVHKFQWLYAWILYTLYFPSNLLSQLRYLVTGRIAGSTRHSSARWRIGSFAAEKAVAGLVLLPYVILAKYSILVPLVVAALSASLIGACVLVVGHINVGLQYDGEQSSNVDWSTYVATTTASFSTESIFIAWITGGMTHHLAHHLKPAASRRELRRIHRDLVDSISLKTAVSPVEFDTLRDAIRGHAQELKLLGRGASRSSLVPVITSQQH